MLKLRNVYRLLNSRSSWEWLLPWSPGATEDLTWWVTSLDGWNGRLLVLPAACEFQLSTDASGSGWGAVLWAHDCLLASGFWDRRVSEESINYRELLAVYLAFFPSIGCWKNSINSVRRYRRRAYQHEFGSSNVLLDGVAQDIWAFALLMTFRW